MSTFLVIVMLLSLVGCVDGGGSGKTYKTRNRTISDVYFNTYSQVSTYADESDAPIESYVRIAEEILSHYHELFDIYYEYSGVNNICTINKNAGKAPVKVDAELIDFLLYCKELYALTRGKTNVMLGSVLSIWHDCREAADENDGYLDPSELPTAHELQAAAAHTSMDALEIDREASTVYISDPEASLDVGAIAKGYVVDILYERIKERGAESVVLNIGGNVRTIGTKPDGGLWASAITNPDRSSNEAFVCRISLGEASVVTSGDYERYFVSGTEEYHHIIDPATLMPARYFRSVSIIGDGSGLADALSTALFCMSYEDGLALIEELRADGAYYEVLWVDAKGTLRMTDGFPIAS